MWWEERLELRPGAGPWSPGAVDPFSGSFGFEGGVLVTFAAAAAVRSRGRLA
jgi:hypothetical protein